MESHDLEGQRTRRREAADRFVDQTRRHWSADGEWQNDNWSIADGGGGDGIRVRLWHAMGYLESDRDVDAIANRIILGSDADGTCKFAPLQALQVLLEYGSQLTPAAESHLETYLRNDLPTELPDELDFGGRRNNQAAAGMSALLLGGERFDVPEWSAVGNRRLDQVVSLFTRRGVGTEFNSPVYTPITLVSLALLATHHSDPDVRRSARDCEERVWADLLGHYHPPTSGIAGPYSRAKKVNSAGHPHNANTVLYAVLGDRMSITPIETTFAAEGDEPEQIMHIDPAFMRAVTFWQLSTDYHCPPRLVADLATKSSPYRMGATFESRRPTRSGRIATYMTDSYALGVMRAQPSIMGDSGGGVHLRYRRKDPVTHPADVATLYSRYRLEERRLDPDPADTQYHEEGHQFGVADGNTALVAAHTSPTARPDGLERRRGGVSCMKLTLVLPTHYGTVDELRIGDRRVDVPEPDGERVRVDEPAPVFVRDGSVFVGVRPLVQGTSDRPTPTTIDRHGNHAYVSFYNHTGETEQGSFDPDAYDTVDNGLAIEVRDRSATDGFDAFRERCLSAEITDTYRDERTLRRIAYRSDDTRLGIEYDTRDRGIKYTSVDGRVPTGPPLTIDGADVDELPFA